MQAASMGASRCLESCWACLDLPAMGSRFLEVEAQPTIASR
jgi:hypothetical protein